MRLPSSSLRGIPSGCDLRDAGHGLDARCGRGHPANPPRYAVFNQTSSPRFRHSSPVIHANWSTISSLSSTSSNAVFEMAPHKPITQNKEGTAAYVR